MAYLELTPDQIVPPETSMREDMDVDAFRALVATIKNVGLLQPILVKPHGDKWEVVAGERRWRACLEAGLATIPAIEKDLTKVGTALAQAIENLHREDTNPLDDAALFARLTDEDGLSVEEIAQLINTSPGFVSNRLALLRAPADVREQLRAGRITFSVARELMRCPYDDDRMWLLHHAMDRSPTAETVRRWVSDVLTRHQMFPDSPAPTADAPPPAVSDTLRAMCEVHRGEVSLDEIITLRVCGRCYTWLGTVHPAPGTTEAQPAAPPQPAPPPLPEWKLTFVLESNPGAPTFDTIRAFDEAEAKRVLAEWMAREQPKERWILLQVERVENT